MTTVKTGTDREKYSPSDRNDSIMMFPDKCRLRMERVDGKRQAEMEGRQDAENER